MALPRACDASWHRDKNSLVAGAAHQQRIVEDVPRSDLAVFPGLRVRQSQASTHLGSK